MSGSSKNVGGEIAKLNNLTSNVVTSSTLNSSDSIPKLNIKLSSTEYPQVIHNENNTNDCSSKNDTSRTESPLPKLTIRIPKPIDKPLEIMTGQGSPFRNPDNESQQSPRIILKINKNATSQPNESSTLTSTTIIATDELQMRSDSPLQIAKQNEMKRSNTDSSADIAMKKQKLNVDVVQLVSSDSEYDDKEQQSTSYKEPNENEQMPSTILENTRTDLTSTTTTNTSFNTNSGLRSILSRPQMKIQPPPQTLQNFLQSLPPFKSATMTSPDETHDTKTNDVIDLCHDSNDQIDESSLNDNMTAYSELNDAMQVSPRSEKQSTKSNYNSWQYLYSESAKEEIQPVHPLLQQNIERANVLAAMMDAANKQENSEMRNDNNNTAINDGYTDGFDQLNSNDLSVENEGSSSDCIVIEDTASEPFPNEYSSLHNMSEQNTSKKDCVDRDSGVDVSNSVKSVAEDESTPIVKRPRGRPRKGNALKTSVK